jgi:hypothetical protein
MAIQDLYNTVRNFEDEDIVELVQKEIGYYNAVSLAREFIPEE